MSLTFLLHLQLFSLLLNYTIVLLLCKHSTGLFSQLESDSDEVLVSTLVMFTSKSKICCYSKCTLVILPPVMKSESSFGLEVVSKEAAIVTLSLSLSFVLVFCSKHVLTCLFLVHSFPKAFPCKKTYVVSFVSEKSSRTTFSKLYFLFYFILY